MIKNLLIATLAAFTVHTGFSQCVNDYDWGDASYGVSPDPEQGETFVSGVLNEPYTDDIFIFVPEDATAIDPSYPALAIDSAVLNSIIITIGENSYTPEEFGLDLTCNNGGTSVNPCTYLGGQTGCGQLTGTPLIAGEFNVTIDATVYVTLGVAALPYPFSYEGYTLTIEDDLSVTDTQLLSEIKLSPNPFDTRALLQFQSQKGGVANFTIFNLLGEEKMNEKISLTKGLNKLPISAQNLESGIYLYHLEVDDYKVTKRLVVNK